MAKNQNNNVAPATQKTEPGAKKDALATALAQIEKQFGKGAIMKLGDNTAMQVDAISTGSLGLDLALGVGGVPRGRIIEVFGPESSGKTTLALHILAEAQKKGGEVAFIDVEHALDPAYASALGVNIDELLVSQPDTGEQAMEICEALVRSGAIDAIVVDSVAAMVPRAEIEGEMGDSHVGLQARLMSQAMRKLTSVIGKTNTVCVFINQLREKVGIVYGNPEVTTGGRALKYYSSVRIDIRRVEGLKDSSGQFIGNHTRAKIVKNKVAPPFREAEFDIMFGEGISKMSELIDVGVKLGIVQKSGAWFNYGEMRLGQGRDNAKQFLKDHPEVSDEIEKIVQCDPTFFVGFASADPRKESAAEELEKAFKFQNLAGLYINTARLHMYPCDERLFVLYDICKKYKRPIIFQAGLSMENNSLAKYCRPIEFEEVLSKYPEVNICLSHVGWPWVQETAALLLKYENCYTNTALMNFDGPYQIYKKVFTEDMGALWVEHNIADKIMFGSGSPRIRPVRSKRGLDSLGFSEETLEKIYAENAERFLGRE